MKKILVLVLVLISSSIAVFADMKYSIKIGGGFTLGEDMKQAFPIFIPGTYSPLTAPDMHKDYSSNYIAGFAAEFPVSTIFSLQAEVLYAPKTLAMTADIKSIMPGNVMYRRKCDVVLDNVYIEVPVLARFTIADKFSILAGPSVAFLIKNNLQSMIRLEQYSTTTPSGGMTHLWDYYGEADDQFNSVVFNLHMGIEYPINDTMFVEFRYIQGLTPIEKYKGITQDEFGALGSDQFIWLGSHPFMYYSDFYPWGEDNASIESQTMSLMIGYRF